ncbi:hypothetical protein Godav_000951, partial [Gossypium davidsonii]|nr:hypothetical protein [Gossypium davidsonii]MBA0667916.1 hypothetical protein [Gossypium klotzschianum]
TARNSILKQSQGLAAFTSLWTL